MKPWVLALLAGAYLVGYAEGYFVGEREGKDTDSESGDVRSRRMYSLGYEKGREVQRQEMLARSAKVNGG
jgi:hypothetical protein